MVRLTSHLRNAFLFFYIQGCVILTLSWVLRIPSFRQIVDWSALLVIGTRKD